MENASKAILIAGGMLIAMLVVSLIIYARSSYSGYFASQQEFKDIQDVTTFNKQFTNYERENVTGNEILSLINRIVDYNIRESYKGDNNLQASPIDLCIELGTEETRKKFTFDGETLKLFENKYYEIDDISDKIDYAIAEICCEEDIISISKNIQAIFIIEDGLSEDEKQQKINKYNAHITIDEKRVSTEKELYLKKDYVLKYYEYMQFKKGIFKCTGIEYDKDTGRVSKLNFEFTGEIE